MLSILTVECPGHAAQAQFTSAIIATPQQALDLAHEFLDTDRYGLKAFPAGCYDMSADKRDDGLYIVHVSAKPNQKCEISYGKSITALAFEINPSNGATTGVDLPGRRNQREPIFFDLQDEQGHHLLREGSPYPWTLEGTTKRLRDTEQCELNYAIPAFERMNSYSFSLKATRQGRELTMFYYVNSFYPPSYASKARGGIALIRSTTDSIGVRTDHETLATYPADLVPISRDWTNEVLTMNDVSFNVTVTEQDAKALLSLLAKADVAIMPMLDGTTQSALTLSSRDFAIGATRDLHVEALAAFQRCLGVIWKK